ncbi:MAG TPA: hypothetical protein V6D19_04545 [Stenomitos sp.]
MPNPLVTALFSRQQFYKRCVYATTLCALALNMLPVRADEVWGSYYGKVVYQTDRGKSAIWTYGDQAKGAMFIDGLAGQYQGRGTYYGYWRQSESKVKCDAYREGRDGRRTYHWGTLRLQFLDPNFPSRWSAEIGYCNQPPTLVWRGYPIVGEGETHPLPLP